MGVKDWFFGEKDIQHARPSFLWGFGRPNVDQMRKDVGHGLDSSVVMAPIQWVQRAMVEAPYAVEIDDEIAPDNNLVRLLDKPNEAYSGKDLLKATIFSWFTSGNAYWLIDRNGRGEPTALWYAPHWLVCPKWPDNGSKFISHYEYKPGNAAPIRIEPEDIIHFRDGIDPRNPRLGLGALSAALTQIWTDDNASAMVAGLIKNSGVPGMIVSPKENSFNQVDVDMVKTYIESEFSGTRSGKPMVFSGPTDVKQYGFSPQEMDLSSVHNISEERVCALIGIPAAVVGFGTGLEQTKVGATMGEMRRLAWQNGIIPLQECLAETINNQLAPQFRRLTGMIVFDRSKVSALKEDENDLFKRNSIAVQGGWMKVGEAREAVGLEAGPEDDQYLRPFAFTSTPTPEKGHAIETKAHDHTELEMRLSQNAPRMASVPPELEALQQTTEQRAASLQAGFEAVLVSFFDALGAKAEEAARTILSRKDANIDTDQILDEIDMLAEGVQFQSAYGIHYANVARSTFEDTGATLGLATDLPDPIAREIIATGGSRAGLVDINAQTRAIIFETLEQGRIDGLGADAMARQIRDDVPKGPWTSPQIRARVIARTETKFAQNMASMARAASMPDTEHMLIFDARLGGTDEVCMALAGRVVTIDEARQLAADEHPNGTRSFSPLPAALAAEAIASATGG